MTSLKSWQKIFLVFIGFAMVGPFVPLVLASLSFRWGWPDLLPSIWWWEKRDVVSSPLAWDYVFDPVSRIVPAIGNTLLIAAIVTVLALLLSLPAAKTLARERFRGKDTMELFLLSPLIIPEIVAGLGMLFIFITLSFYGNLLAVAVAQLVPVLPYMVRMLYNVYSELDSTFEEQASLLGANRWQIFWRIELPLISPALLAASLFSVLISTNVFLITFYMGKGQVETLATVLFSKMSSGGAIDPVSAALALIISLPGLLFLAISHRTLNENIFSSGIKSS